MKAYKIEYHSFVDLVTNSSTEMFMSTDKAIIEFFKEIGNIGGESRYGGNYVKVMTFKQFCEETWIGDFKEDDPERFEKEYGEFKDDDEILVVQEDTEDCESIISKLMEKLNFKRLD